MTAGNPDIQSLLDDLNSRVSDVAKTLQMRELWRRCLQAFAVIIGAAVLLVFAEAVGFFASDVRTGLVYYYILGIVPAAVIYCLPPLMRIIGIMQGASIEATARMIGHRFPDIRDRLRNVLQLGTASGFSEWVSSELIEESIRVLHADLDGTDLSDAVDRTPVQRTARRTGLIAAAALVLALAWPSSISGSVVRLWQYDTEFIPPVSYSFTMTPGNTDVAKGTDVSLRILVRAIDGSDGFPDALRLFLRGEGQTNFEGVDVPASSPGEFRFDLPDIRFSRDYYAMIDDETSDAYRITVLDWPSFQSFRVRLEPPGYARIPSTLQEDFSGDISALAGTKVTLSGRASKELSRGEILFADSSIVPLETDDVSFRSGFTLDRPGSYSVRVHDTQGLSNRAPISYQLRIVPDASPNVAITQPGRDIDIAGGEAIGLFVEANDDFGVSKLILHYRLSHSRFVRVSDDYLSVSIPLPPGEPRDVATSYSWNLESLDLVPEDVVEYFVEAYDNDDINGPKSARSRMYTLRLPSLEEVFTDVETGHEEALEEMDEAFKEAEQLREDIAEINRDLKTNKEFDWQDQQKAEEMAKKVEDIQKRLEKTEQQLKSMTDEMQRQQVLSPETLEKYLELQSLFEEMNTQELQQALRQMQQAMEGVRKDQLQQALQQVEFSEQRFRQGIERSLNLLKRIQIEQRMDEASTRAEELSARQEELKESSSDRSEETANEQEKLAADQQRLEELLRDLQRRMEEFFTEMPADQLNDLNTQLQQQQLQEQMKQAAQQMRQGEMQRAQQAQQQIQNSLETLTQQLQAMRQQMLEQQTDQILNSLRRATTDLLELSQRQEQIKNDAQSSPDSSPSLRENAQKQMQTMSQLNNIAENLSALAQKSFAVTPGMGRSLGEAMQAMQNAMRDLEVRNGRQAAQDQTGAMGSLNKTAQQVQQSLEAMMQGAQGSPGGMGLMQQLQMMAGQQMQLNAETQRMGEGHGEGESMRRAAEAARISREQDAVRKSLEQLQREAEGSGEQDRIMGDLDRIASEMREVVRNLEQNNVDDQTIRQQERILSRLLDASRSMRERDFEKRREATAGKRFTRRGPASLPTDDAKNWLRQEMLRALEKGYSRDYQELIRKYFQELEQTEAGSD